MTVDGPATAIIDGSESYLARYPQPGATGDDWKRDMPWHQPDHRLLIDGVGSPGRSSYEIRTSGRIEADEYDGITLNTNDVIDDTIAYGSVKGWRDAFKFAGQLEGLAVDGSARVFLDGDRIDPADYGPNYEHTLTIAAIDPDTRYRLSVDGRDLPRCVRSRGGCSQPDRRWRHRGIARARVPALQSRWLGDRNIDTRRSSTVLPRRVTTLDQSRPGRSPLSQPE
ncbi:MAG: hypothetical protein U5K37_04240 [Natrialbaceae archaeon]|nr:hypothetical protein [Natrialbaceae archaeon]